MGFKSLCEISVARGDPFFQSSAAMWVSSPCRSSLEPMEQEHDADHFSEHETVRVDDRFSRLSAQWASGA